MDDGEEEHGVGDLPVEPDVLVKRQPPYLRPNVPEDIPAHREQDECHIDREDQTCASRHPHREGEGVEAR